MGKVPILISIPLVIAVAVLFVVPLISEDVYAQQEKTLKEKNLEKSLSELEERKMDTLEKIKKLDEKINDTSDEKELRQLNNDKKDLEVKLHNIKNKYIELEDKLKNIQKEQKSDNIEKQKEKEKQKIKQKEKTSKQDNSKNNYLALQDQQRLQTEQIIKKQSELVAQKELEESQSENKKIPKFCSSISKLVCGVDGTTYNNQCFLDANEIILDHIGECVKTVQKTISESQTKQKSQMVSEPIEERICGVGTILVDNYCQIIKSEEPIKKGFFDWLTSLFGL